MKEIFYFNEDISFQLDDEESASQWISSVIEKEDFRLQSLNYIFCSDNYLLQINKEYLSHDYFTDIITFDQSETPNTIEGDIFISIDRVQENADQLQKPFKDELYRVMIHGVLHMMGYEDKSDIQKEQMRKKEEACLSLQKF